MGIYSLTFKNNNVCNYLEQDNYYYTSMILSSGIVSLQIDVMFFLQSKHGNLITDKVISSP